MSIEENVLDSDELINSNSDNKMISKLIGLGFFISLPIIFFLFILVSDDAGLFLPRTELIDSIIPESFIYIKEEYELWCFEGDAVLGIIVYFFILGLINIFFWKNNNKKKFRIFHVTISIVLTLIFIITMIEDDIFHHLKVGDPLGKVGYENKVQIFYRLFIFWLIIQIFYILAFIHDKLHKKDKV